MELTHRFTVPTPVGETWEHFQDIVSLAECFPGATVTGVEDDSFTGSCKVKLGPVALVYNGSGSFVEKDDAAHRFVVEAKGKDKRGNGTAGATVILSMADAGGATDVDVRTDLAITGKPAQFGRGVMQDVSDKLLGQFVACLEMRLGAQPEAVDQDAGPASVPTGAAAVAAPPGDADAGPASAPSGGDAQAAAAPPHEAGRAPRSAPPPRAERPGTQRSASEDDALDLGATVLPVLVKSYWKPVAGALAVLLGLWWLVSRRNR
ncbi:SRPBCC domain-containing protein [Nocardioides sp. GCM10027113]|uniref:SRPBCC family protein n=1 Tax=unclassified Nocardioides TaxID=2615069 RepID=UPI003617E3B7